MWHETHGAVPAWGCLPGWQDVQGAIWKVARCCTLSWQSEQGRVTWDAKLWQRLHTAQGLAGRVLRGTVRWAASPWQPTHDTFPMCRSCVWQPLPRQLGMTTLETWWPDLGLVWHWVQVYLPACLPRAP